MIKYNARAHAHEALRPAKPHHVLAPLHELFVDDLAGIVFPGLDVDGLLHDSVRATAERLACAVLRVGKANSNVLATASFHQLDQHAPGRELLLQETLRMTQSGWRELR